MTDENLILLYTTADIQSNGGMERIDTLESAELTLGEADNVNRNKSVRFRLIKNGLRMFKQQQQQLDSTELSRIHEKGSPQFVQVLKSYYCLDFLLKSLHDNCRINDQFTHSRTPCNENK